MAAQEPLEVRSRDDLLAAARVNGASLAIADCQSLDRERMAMTVEISGTPGAVQGTITTLRKMVGVRQAYEVSTDSPKTRVLMTLDKPRICRASDNNPILCLDCPFDAAEIPVRWRPDVRRTTDTGQIISMEGDEGIRARIEDISPLDKSVTLNRKERGILAVAIEKGYFDFPRRLTLEGLSRLVGVEPAALREILRKAE